MHINCQPYIIIEMVTDLKKALEFVQNYDIHILLLHLIVFCGIRDSQFHLTCHVLYLHPKLLSYLHWITDYMFCFMVDQLNMFISKECNMIVNIMARVHKPYWI